LIEVTLLVEVMLLGYGSLFDVTLEGRRIEWSVKAQGPRERPAALRQREAFGVAVQVRTTSVRSASRVRKQDSLDRDDAQQVRLGSAFPAPDTCPDRLRTPRHRRV
jgi:hypothetical protein